MQGLSGIFIVEQLLFLLQSRLMSEFRCWISIELFKNFHDISLMEL